MNTNPYKKLLFIPVILWMIVIFMFSNQNVDESSELSGGITEAVVKAVEKIAPSQINFDRLEHYIRKLGHVTEYLILGFLVYLAFYKNNVFKKNSILWCLLICALYAASDEIHQAFVPGRGPGVKDVLIDSCGAFLGIYFCSLIINNLTQIKFERTKR